MNEISTRVRPNGAVLHCALLHTRHPSSLPFQLVVNDVCERTSISVIFYRRKTRGRAPSLPPFEAGRIGLRLDEFCFLRLGNWYHYRMSRRRSDSPIDMLFEVLEFVFSHVPPWTSIPVALIGGLLIVVFFPSFKPPLEMFGLFGWFLGGMFALVCLAAVLKGWMMRRIRIRDAGHDFR